MLPPIGHNIVFGAIVDNLFRLEFLSTVYLQVANLSANEGDKLFEKRKRRLTSFGRKEYKVSNVFIDVQSKYRSSGGQPQLENTKGADLE